MADPKSVPSNWEIQPQWLWKSDFALLVQNRKDLGKEIMKVTVFASNTNKVNYFSQEKAVFEIFCPFF